jgi:hypothetical protein
VNSEGMACQPRGCWYIAVSSFGITQPLESHGAQNFFHSMQSTCQTCTVAPCTLLCHCTHHAYIMEVMWLMCARGTPLHRSRRWPCHQHDRKFRQGLILASSHLATAGHAIFTDVCADAQAGWLVHALALSRTA